MDKAELKRGEWELITGCALFHGIDEGIVAGVLETAGCRFVSLCKGAVVFDAYDYRNCLGLVLSGSVNVTKPSSSRYTMATLGRGSLFGSANLYDDDTAAVTVLTASSNCRIVFFPRELLETIMLETQQVALNYIRFLTGRVRFLNDKIEGLVSVNAEAALKQYLIQNTVTCGEKRIVRLHGSISALAETLNIGRASLYRAFEALRQSGSIIKNGKEIEIITPGGLSDFD